jgi:hypothetical protein
MAEFATEGKDGIYLSIDREKRRFQAREKVPENTRVNS